MPRDTYSQPHLPDPVLEPAVVLELARWFEPHVEAVTAVDETGGEARTYLIDDRLVFKTQRPHRLRPRTSLAKEVFFLQHIAQHAPDLPVPRALGYGHAEAHIEYSLLTRMPGAALLRTTLSLAQRVEVARALGRTLRRVHQLPQLPLAESGLLPVDRDAVDVRARFRELLEESAARIELEGKPWTLPLAPRAVAGRALAALPEELERAALHSNPWHEHTFVNPDSGTYIGLIDFGDAYISHPSFDLRRWRSTEERAALISGYTETGPVSADFRQAWRVAQIAGSLAAIANAPDLAPAALAELPRLLSSL
ncbi:MAG: aminoglycoside phosphotransferase family protein [Chloroflexi bacterium]|nr:aminoglycoside phosphotransferase family protein [Chloroflexota bacterium]